VANGNIDATASFSENCTVGINDFNNSSLLVYPNPATTTLTIQTDNHPDSYREPNTD